MGNIIGWKNTMGGIEALRWNVPIRAKSIDVNSSTRRPPRGLSRHPGNYVMANPTDSGESVDRKRGRQGEVLFDFTCPAIGRGPTTSYLEAMPVAAIAIREIVKGCPSSNLSAALPNPTVSRVSS